MVLCFAYIVCLILLPCSRAEDYDLYDDSFNEQQARTAAQLPTSNLNTDPFSINVPGLGTVRGRMGFKTINKRPINGFYGLKYGQVGVGLARFQEALEPVAHPGHGNQFIDATLEAASCPQFPDLEKVIEAEARGINPADCLTLNVFAPAQASSLPVLVFVHGEMLFDGSAEEGQPDYFLEHDVILVSINYRLAPFGFLTTLSNEMPGNVALSDIHLALKWVQRYIRSFGGSPDQVTLIGQAGGATLVHTLSLSGKASGLYHKLILQSGTALNPYFLDEDPLKVTRTLAISARCPLSSNNIRIYAELHECFRSLSTSELVNKFKQHWEQNERFGLQFTGGFKLVVGDRLGYIPTHPAALVANNNVPTIAGVTKDAGAFILSRFYDQILNIRSRNISDYISVVLKHTTTPQHYQLWKNWALQQIFAHEHLQNPTPQSVTQGLLELINLILYRGPIIDAIRYTSKRYPTYLYCFDYRGAYHRFGHLDNPLPFGIDATLSDDNIYLFPYPEEVSRLNPRDKSVAHAIVEMWVNFAQSGDPNSYSVLWPNVSSEYGPFLRFTNAAERAFEIDYHFGEGIPVPNLYPHYFTTTTTSTTTTTTTARTPYAQYTSYYNQNWPEHRDPYANYRGAPRHAAYQQGK